MTVTILGRSDNQEPVRRSGAKFGDGVYVSGPLGGSILGRHMTFEPRIRLARQLAHRGVSAMMDISDGLSEDLARICTASGVGAVIEADRVPVHADAHILAARDGRSALEHALHDGEDHELLYCSSVTDIEGIRIGMIISEPGMWLARDGKREELHPGGWEHGL